MPFLAVVGLFGLALSFTIGILDPFLYTEKVRTLAPPAYKNTALGLLTVLTLLVALVWQPVVGWLSDRTRGPWGRRAPYLAAGAIGLTITLSMIVLADSLWLLVLSAMLLSASTNTTQGAWQALIPDRVPEVQHGTAAGIKALMELIGIVGAVAVAGLTLSRGHLWGGPVAASLLFYAILLVTLFTLWGTKGTGNLQARRARVNRLRQRNGDASEAPARLFDAPVLRFRLFLRSFMRRIPPAFPWWMLNRFLFWSAAIAVRTFMLNYVVDVLSIPPTEAQALSSRIFLVLGAGVFLLALPAGAVADRIGRRPLLVGAGLSAAAGTMIFVISQDFRLLFVAGGLIAIGAGIFASASWALATDLAPTGEGAQYLGLANVATVLGSISGRLGGPLIDGVNQLAGSVALGYTVVFGIAGLFFVGSSLAVLKIAEGRRWRA
jgi:MFS family permease